jgi:cysteine desulfurase
MESDNMIYLDYSATTPVNEIVLNVFVDASRRFFVNPNSAYPEAKASQTMIEGASERIRSHLHLTSHEVIYTSGATEANNLAIKGVALKQQNIGKHIIMSPFEHSSVSACFGYLQKQGFSVDVLSFNSDGTVDLENLKQMMRQDTILVSVCGVASELGILQPIDAISKIVHSYPNAVFHSDMTQAIGKTAVKLEGVDLITLSAHKIYGLKGVGALLRRDAIKIIPQIHGGKSSSNLRSGTPSLPLVLSLEKAIDIATSDLAKNHLIIRKLHQQLISGLNDISGCVINSTVAGIPQITNVSVVTMEANDLQAYLSQQGIYVSTQSACSSGTARSEAVYRLTKSEAQARSSIRISISHLTTESEINALLKAIGSVAL